jgi:hypothetical protein
LVTTAIRPREIRRPTSVLPLALVAIALLAFAAITLPITHAIDYDPEGWIVYGREALGTGALNTNSFPAWKPLPAVVIGLFSLISRSASADVDFWLIVGRACGAACVVETALLANRYAGRWAALLAVALLLLSPWWLEEGALGLDGAPTAALVLGALLAHQRAWPRIAIVCGALVALMRPEAAPFVVAYGLWLWRTRRLKLWELGVVVAPILILWAVPTLLHAGKSPGGISSHGSGTPGNAVSTAFPFWEVILQSAHQLHPLPTLVALIALVGTLLGLWQHRGNQLPSWARRTVRLWGSEPEERLLLGCCALWILIIAAETQYGFSGIPRYLISALAVLNVIVAVVVVRAAAGSSRTALFAAVVAVTAITGATAISGLKASVHLIRQRDREIAGIRAEATLLKCPGYYWTDAANNAYLAVITDQSLPATLRPLWLVPKRPLRRRGLVICAPAGWNANAKPPQ